MTLSRCIFSGQRVSCVRSVEVLARTEEAVEGIVASCKKKEGRKHACYTPKQQGLQTCQT